MITLTSQTEQSKDFLFPGWWKQCKSSYTQTTSLITSPSHNIRSPALPQYKMKNNKFTVSLEHECPISPIPNMQSCMALQPLTVHSDAFPASHWFLRLMSVQRVYRPTTNLHRSQIFWELINGGDSRWFVCKCSLLLIKGSLPWVTWLLVTQRSQHHLPPLSKPSRCSRQVYSNAHLVIVRQLHQTMTAGEDTHPPLKHSSALASLTWHTKTQESCSQTKTEAPKSQPTIFGINRCMNCRSITFSSTH